MPEKPIHKFKFDIRTFMEILDCLFCSCFLLLNKFQSIMCPTNIDSHNRISLFKVGKGITFILTSSLFVISAKF
jgi:hypothetical protein